MFDRRLWQESRTQRATLGLAVGLGFLAGAFTVAQAWLLSQVVAEVFLEGQSLDAVMPQMLALLAVIVLRVAVTGGGEVAAKFLAVRVKQGLRERLFGHLLALGPAYRHEERSGELVNTVVEGVEALEAYFSQYLPGLAMAAIIPLTILLVVFPLDLLSGIVLLVTAPLIPLFMVLIGRWAEALTKRQWGLLSRLSAHYLDVLQGLKTLKMLGRSRQQAGTIRQFSQRYAEVTMKVLRVAFLSALALEMLATVSTAIVAVEIGLRLLYGQLAFAQTLFILVLAPEFYLPLRTLGARFHAGMEGVAAAERIFTILDSKLQVRSGGRRVAPPAFREQIAFEDVHYAYDEGQRPSLHGVSFTIEAGEKVALVGPSGAGKSTVAALLLRFLEAQRGQITVDGVAIDGYAPELWREMVAWVPQAPYLFCDTVAANLQLGAPEANLERVIWAAKQAQVHEEVMALPRDYQTVIGERGARLSGGQAQRIALGRAFLKDAPLMILDEPAASLDPANEARLVGATARLLKGRSALIIAHRLGTASQADKIVVLGDGRVVEQGSHARLMAQGGHYQRLVTVYRGAG